MSDTKKLRNHQLTDLKGDIPFNANSAVLIAGSATTAIFTGYGVIQGVTIWKDVDGGTIYFTNTAGNAIDGLPNSTNKAILDYAGAFEIPRMQISAGLKAVTENATGAVISIFVST